MKTENKNCGIYAWRNRVNGKMYVGQSVNLRKRKRDFLKFYVYEYAGDLINKARQKYNSPDYWEYEIIEYCTREELNKKEEIFIYFYNTLNKDLGYNLCTGGLNSSPSRETRIRISNSLKGHKLKDITKQRISESLRGKKLSDETKEKLKEYWKNNTISIYQIDIETRTIIKIWDNSSAIERELGYDSSTIIKVCRGKKKTFKGYIWVYETTYDEEKIRNLIIPDFTIVQLNDKADIINEWKSPAEAGRYFNISTINIHLILKGKKPNDINIKYKYPDKASSPYAQRSRAVLQYDSEMNLIKEWDMVKRIVDELGIDRNGIERSCKANADSNNRRMYKGFIWRYKDESK